MARRPKRFRTGLYGDILSGEEREANAARRACSQPQQKECERFGLIGSGMNATTDLWSILPMESEPPRDPFEQRLRFGCGFLFGAGAGFLIGMEVAALFSAVFWLCVAAMACVSGFLAMRNGDEFWRSLSDGFRWW